MTLRTPKSVTPVIRKFCESIVRDSLPVYVPVRPETGARIDHCFLNVSEKVRQSGGELIHGWMIWLWPEVMLRAQFHGVWLSPEGQLIDLTPKQNGTASILFVPDPSRIYDFKEHRRIEDIRLALRNDQLIDELFAAKVRLFEYEEAHSLGTGLQMRINQDTYTALRADAEAKLFRLLRKYLRPNDPCFCGSGRKVKKCHGVVPQKPD